MQKEKNERTEHPWRKNIVRKVKKIVGISCMLAAIWVLLSPEWVDGLTRNRTVEIRHGIQTDTNRGDLPEWGSPIADTSDTVKVDLLEVSQDPLWEKVHAYNFSLYSSNQKEQIEQYKKAEVWEENQIFGTLQIPSIQVDLPLYVGATEENLSQGAAVLEGTSLPVGGENTHSVISGHRGWKGASFLKEIEKVSWGDVILLTNPWETLVYTVTGMDILEPHESEPLLIQEGKDLVTILTCHPYHAPRNLRYVIYAERSSTVESVGIVHKEPAAEKASSEQKMQYEANKELLLKAYGSSALEIKWETRIRRGAGISIGFLLILVLRRRKYSYS